MLRKKNSLKIVIFFPYIKYKNRQREAIVFTFYVNILYTIYNVNLHLVHF